MKSSRSLPNKGGIANHLAEFFDREVSGTTKANQLLPAASDFLHHNWQPVGYFVRNCLNSVEISVEQIAWSNIETTKPHFAAKVENVRIRVRHGHVGGE